MQKNKDAKILKELHRRACHTAKVITVAAVESGQPICNILSKHESVNKENVLLLLYRLQKMYQLKSEAKKILTIFLKLEHDKSF